jgi:outer membrane cobalamin receptor
LCAAPRGAVIVMPSSNQSFEYLYGRAFRAPNMYELYYYADATSYLCPESIDTHELVWEQYVGEWLRTSLSGYRYTASRLITLNTVDRVTPSGLAPRRTLAGTSVAAATVANLTFTKRVGGAFELVGSVRNLFDAQYADPASDEHAVGRDSAERQDDPHRHPLEVLDAVTAASRLLSYFRAWLCQAEARSGARCRAAI